MAICEKQPAKVESLSQCRLCRTSVLGRRIMATGCCGYIVQGLNCYYPKNPTFGEKKRDCNVKGALYRVNHLNWWEEELAGEREMEEGKKNLKKAGCRVNYIITHCCSTGTQVKMGGEGLYDADREAGLTEEDA